VLKVASLFYAHLEVFIKLFRRRFIHQPGYLIMRGISFAFRMFFAFFLCFPRSNDS
jgi:hypothetical protein